VLAMVLDKQSMTKLTEKEYLQLKLANDRIKDIWNLHLQQDDIEDFLQFLDAANIWDLIAIDG